MTNFIRTDSSNSDFQYLVSLLDADLAARDGVEHSFYAPYNTIVNLRNALVCYIDNRPAGCGAFKEYEKGTAEIKRMFVLPGYRDQGLGFRILKELESWAAGSGYAECVLETGKRQPEAIRLYKKAGYTLMKNYGQYENIENSVCMKKRINAMEDHI